LGIKKLEAETRDRTVLFHNYWNKEGKQLLENGAGLYINEYSIFKDEVSRQENEYKDYKRHGRQWTYTNGILTLYQEMANGKEHGVTKTFNNQGKLQETILYENGKELSREQNGN